MNIFKQIFENKDTDTKTLYQYLAQLNHFVKINETIYVNKKQERFVLTKYGFQPVEQSNLHLIIEELTAKIAKLEQINKKQDLKIDALTVDAVLEKETIKELLEIETAAITTLKQTIDDLEKKQALVLHKAQVVVTDNQLPKLYNELLKNNEKIKNENQLLENSNKKRKAEIKSKNEEIEMLKNKIRTIEK